MISEWWFQVFLIFIPTWGNDPIWQTYFSKGFGSTTNQIFFEPSFVLLFKHHFFNSRNPPSHCKYLQPSIIFCYQLTWRWAPPQKNNHPKTKSSRKRSNTLRQKNTQRHDATQLYASPLFCDPWRNAEKTPKHRARPKLLSGSPGHRHNRRWVHRCHWWVPRHTCRWSWAPPPSRYRWWWVLPLSPHRCRWWWVLRWRDSRCFCWGPEGVKVENTAVIVLGPGDSSRDHFIPDSSWRSPVQPF